jgi:hypothetical protein
LTGRASEFCSKKLRAGLGLGLTADGAKHRWSKIVQVGPDTVKTEVCEEKAQIGVLDAAWVKLSGRDWQQKAVPGLSSGHG